MAQRQRPGPSDARTALQRYQLHGVRETGEELGRGSYAAVVHGSGLQWNALCSEKDLQHPQPARRR